MKKLNKVAVLFASAALAAPAAFAQVTTGGDNWRSSDGTVWRNGTNELCWRDANWTPATADEKCDGALKKAAPPAAAPAPRVAPPPPPPPAPAPAPRVAPPPPPPPAPAPAPAAPVSEKVTYAADAFFDFDKAVLKPEAKAKLDDLVGKTSAIALEVIIAVGHTDAAGGDAYNQKLSVKRAEAVKSYLVGKGVEKNRVYTEGKGEKQPVADNKTAEGRAKNRRVEIEVVGTRASK
jgi:OOP family OmpA-OmpF porin